MHLATALLFGAALWFLPLAAYAQTTRTEALEQERAERAKQLRPYEPKRLEKLILNAEEGKLRRLIAPHNGFFVEYRIHLQADWFRDWLRRGLPSRPLRAPGAGRVRGR